MTGEVFVFEGAGIGAYLSFNNTERPHQALERRTPAEVFEEGRNQVRQPELTTSPRLAPAKQWFGVLECSLTGTDSCTNDRVHLRRSIA